ncbi:hypothetical protein AALO_G00090230 [Alosa alosa]|uniref:Uncharacterized protein n=1 Tax=Alosa alosa TaxID=278164 RepID=A0AAV6GRA2_9TELE|nr:hypothetical protein AALO_G00090230 [Alosa alosa]
MDGGWMVPRTKRSCWSIHSVLQGPHPMSSLPPMTHSTRPCLTPAPPFRTELKDQQLDPFFIEDFTPLFISLNAKSFSRGSIIHESDLTFTANVTLPSSTAIYNTMLRAAQSGDLTFTITTLKRHSCVLGSSQQCGQRLHCLEPGGHLSIGVTTVVGSVTCQSLKCPMACEK